MNQPSWTQERFKQVKKKIDKEAARALARLNARTVAMICFFNDGDRPLVLLEGGTSPLPAHILYAQLAHFYAAQAQLAAAEAKLPKPPIDGVVALQ